MYQSGKKLFWGFNRNIRFGVPWNQKRGFCQIYAFMYVYLAVCSATDYWIDVHPTRNRHISVRAFRPQHKMVRKVSEAAGRTLAEGVSRDWVSMLFVSISISITIINSFITKWVRKRKLVSVPDTVCLFLLVPPRPIPYTLLNPECMSHLGRSVYLLIPRYRIKGLQKYIDGVLWKLTSSVEVERRCTIYLNS